MPAPSRVACASCNVAHGSCQWYLHARARSCTAHDRGQHSQAPMYPRTSVLRAAYMQMHASMSGRERTRPRALHAAAACAAMRGRHAQHAHTAQAGDTQWQCQHCSRVSTACPTPPAPVVAAAPGASQLIAFPRAGGGIAYHTATGSNNPSNSSYAACMCNSRQVAWSCGQPIRQLCELPQVTTTAVSLRQPERSDLQRAAGASMSHLQPRPAGCPAGLCCTVAAARHAVLKTTGTSAVTPA